MSVSPISTYGFLRSRIIIGTRHRSFPPNLTLWQGLVWGDEFVGHRRPSIVPPAAGCTSAGVLYPGLGWEYAMSAPDGRSEYYLQSRPTPAGLVAGAPATAAQKPYRRHLALADRYGIVARVHDHECQKKHGGGIFPTRTPRRRVNYVIYLRISIASCWTRRSTRRGSRHLHVPGDRRARPRRRQEEAPTEAGFGGPV